MSQAGTLLISTLESNYLFWECIYTVHVFIQVCTVLHFFHILLCYSLIPKLNKWFFCLKYLHTTPHNDNMKKVFHVVIMTPGIQAKEFNLCFNRPENFVSHGLRVLQVHFGKLQAGCHVPFTKEFLPSGHSTIQAWLVDCAEMVVLLEGSPLSTEEHWSSDRVTIGFLVTSLTKALFPRSLSLDVQPALGRVLVVPNFFHLWMMKATVLIGTFKAAENVSVPFPRFFSSRQSCLGDNSFELHACKVLRHALSTVGPYR